MFFVERCRLCLGRGCSKKEQTQNPNAVINALKTYENSIRYKAKGNKKYMVAESMEDITEGSESGSERSSTVEPATPPTPTPAEPTPSRVAPAGSSTDTVDKTILAKAKKVPSLLAVLVRNFD